MASAISPSVFLTRDFLEHILPTIIAACLFLPFLVKLEGAKLESMLVGALVLGYFVSALTQRIVRVPWIHRGMHLLYRWESHGVTLQQIKSGHQWRARNWNYDRLFYLLNKDDREYLYLTRAYLNLAQDLCFYLMLYLLVNTVLLAGSLWIEFMIVGFSWEFWAVWTPMIGGAALITWLVMLLSFLTFCSLYSAFLQEFGSLFDEWGSYAQWAERYHIEQGGIATGIWGAIKRSKAPVDKTLVKLVLEDKVIQEAETDSKGRFQFPGAYATCLGKRCALRLPKEEEKEFLIRVAPQVVPEFEVDLNKPANERKETGALVALAGLGLSLMDWLQGDSAGTE